ncbi:hypothetical protein EXU85_02550 [Spirosoma sp. KCTC 42546]|uniref:hypothetical protein n=1 Tax=Spirosoma sp. KCTC 42546 TaxID=2520506 RepID=UPI0011572882|nr:hypothetical protein [Spirosoma sp. KCTC 42546]QDK77536.1 hypothetical protein EXU85_02550 [Spirosoma sp. KCTC 42546]
MKTINAISTMLFIITALNSCTPKMTFVTSAIVPAATGEVNVKKDKNKNYVINLNVQNLAEPNNLNPSKNTYLVWAESTENSAKKLGQIMPSGKSLKASLTTSVINEPKAVFITAEDNAEAQYPAGQVVLTTRR